MKSIMHDKRSGTCYLCMLLNNDYDRRDTQEHHVIFGTAGRRLSEKHGLKVYLCLQHHTSGREAVHNNSRNARYLQREAQRIFEKSHSYEGWMEIFGINYL